MFLGVFSVLLYGPCLALNLQHPEVQRCFQILGSTGSPVSLVLRHLYPVLLRMAQGMCMGILKGSLSALRWGGSATTQLSCTTCAIAPHQVSELRQFTYHIRPPIWPPRAWVPQQAQVPQVWEVPEVAEAWEGTGRDEVESEIHPLQ